MSLSGIWYIKFQSIAVRYLSSTGFKKKQVIILSYNKSINQ